LRAKFGRFRAVKLQHMQSANLDGRENIGRIRVHENPHADEGRRQAGGNAPRRLKGNMAGTPGVKHEAERVGARLHGGRGVPGAGQAANLDFDIHPPI
jgi:hypothetical protein